MRKKPAGRSVRETTHFLNVDLDIHSKSDLQPLVTAMGKKVHVLFVGRIKRTYQAHLELWDSGLSQSADLLIRNFSAIIRGLPKEAVKLWNAAKVRDFNIGVQAGMQPNSHEIAIALETVRAAAEVNARIVLTVYSPELVRATKRPNS